MRQPKRKRNNALPSTVMIRMEDDGDGNVYPVVLKQEDFDDGDVVGVYRLNRQGVIRKKAVLQ